MACCWRQSDKPGESHGVTRRATRYSARRTSPSRDQRANGRLSAVRCVHRWAQRKSRPARTTIGSSHSVVGHPITDQPHRRGTRPDQQVGRPLVVGRPSTVSRGDADSGVPTRISLPDRNERRPNAFTQPSYRRPLAFTSSPYPCSGGINQTEGSCTWAGCETLSDGLVCRWRSHGGS